MNYGDSTDMLEPSQALLQSDGSVLILGYRHPVENPNDDITLLKMIHQVMFFGQKRVVSVGITLTK